MTKHSIDTDDSFMSDSASPAERLVGLASEIKSAFELSRELGHEGLMNLSDELAHQKRTRQELAEAHKMGFAETERELFDRAYVVLTSEFSVFRDEGNSRRMVGNIESPEQKIGAMQELYRSFSKPEDLQEMNAIAFDPELTPEQHERCLESVKWFRRNPPETPEQ